MRISKAIHIFTGLMLVSVLANAQNVEKTLVKSFNLQGKQTVEIDLKGKVQVEKWNNSIMRIQFSVALENGTSSMLKSLVEVGRYNLKSSIEGDVMKIYAPGIEREVRIKGKQLLENSTYTVYVPEDVNVDITDTATSSTTSKTSSLSSLK